VVCADAGRGAESGGGWGALPRVQGALPLVPRARCTPSCYSDEHYIQTLLYAVQDDASLANRSVTWIDWSRGGPHPMSFRAWEVGKGVFNKVRAQPHCEWNGRKGSYCYLFARQVQERYGVCCTQAGQLLGLLTQLRWACTCYIQYMS